MTDDRIEDSRPEQTSSQASEAHTQRAPAPYPPPYGAYGQPGQPYSQSPPPPPFQYTPEKPMSNLAIASMVLGGASVLVWIIAPVTGIIGIVTGIMGMKQSKQPAGTHKGWGLALAGTITSSAMWLISVAMIVGMAFLFVFVDKQQKDIQHDRIVATQEIESDLTTIRVRMELYFTENSQSLEPGGPIVNDGRTGLYPEDAPKVEGSLKISDLVSVSDLNNRPSEYTLSIEGKTKATITHTRTNTRMIISDIGAGSWSLEETHGFGK